MSADVHLLSGAYALDAIDDLAEREDFEHHLDECPGCRQEVRSLRAAVGVLGEAVAVVPPSSLRSRVMAEVVRTPQRPPNPTEGLSLRPRAVAAASSRRRRPGLRAAAAAAAVVVGVGGLAGAGAELLQARRTDEQAAQVLAIAGDPAAKRVTGAVAGGGSATVVVAGSQAALVTNGVPGLADGRTYQLWLVRPAGIVSAGLGPGGTGAAGRWSRIIAGVRPGDKVAISVEPAGGSMQPTTKPLTALPV